MDFYKSLKIRKLRFRINMELGAVLGGVRKHVLSSMARREARLSIDRPLISFTFDDFPKTSLFTGGAILGKYGLRGTYYAAPALVGHETEVGRIFDPADLPHLLAGGHELAGHTYSHISACETNLSTYEKDVRKGEKELTQFLGNARQLNFSYPFGDVTIEVKKKVGPTMPSCRGIFPGLNGPLVDLNLLRANSLYGGDERFATAESLIEQNMSRKRWLIFYTHDVREAPSPYGCTPRLFGVGGPLRDRLRGGDSNCGTRDAKGRPPLTRYDSLLITSPGAVRV